jgi:NADH-quinone oxidoreductase subunit L
LANTTFWVLLGFFIPLISFIFYIFFQKLLPKQTTWISVFFSFFSVCIYLYLFHQIEGKEPFQLQWKWFALSQNIQFNIGLFIDVKEALMLVLVHFVSLLVLIYSVSYLKQDAKILRFFAYLSLFIFSMQGLIIADNLLQIFIFWELVGFSSFLLIGFWNEKPKAAQAAKYSFIANRVADCFFLVGIILVYAYFNTLDLDELSKVNFQNPDLYLSFSWIGFLIFVGCMAKSAQFPFQIWLPKAMQGPTPASALIHAATMVAAGVFILIKLSFFLTPSVSNLILCIGILTAFIGAYSALTQKDLKKILAYSTISQLGIMFVAIGLKAYNAAFAHLITHAIFKSGLFLSAGAIIHWMQHAKEKLDLNSIITLDGQNINQMGGLLKYIPFTSIVFLLNAFALIGIPFFVGFYSKEAIINFCFYQASENHSNFYSIIGVLLLLTSLLTSLYMFRLIFKMFLGKLSFDEILKENSIHLHENKIGLLVSPAILGILSLMPILKITTLGKQVQVLLHANHEESGSLVEITSILLILLALFMMLVMFGYQGDKRFKKIIQSFVAKKSWTYKLSYKSFYVDKIVFLLIIQPNIQISRSIAWFDVKLVDNTINLIGIFQVVLAHILAWIDKNVIDKIVITVTSIISLMAKLAIKIQSGKIQNYFYLVLIIFTFSVLIVYFLIYT